MDGSIFFTLLEFLAALFIFAVGALILFSAGVYLHAIRQTTSAISRNYPVIGHFRYWLVHLGDFLRQ